jgi:aminoglycoside phosphotransferase (APT) family kinase protein
VLTAPLERCDSLFLRWDSLQDAAAVLPPALVHGDLVGKNATIRNAGGRAELVAFDWETAGWGPPAADLEQFAEGGRWKELSALEEGSAGGNGGPERLRRLAVTGRAFRLICALEWAVVSLGTGRPRRGVARIADYEGELAAVMRSVEIGD